MFSEYASRFLAQSQSRISFLQPNQNDSDEASRNPLERPRDRQTRASRFTPSRTYAQRPALGNPYQASASHLSQFPFASRTSTAQAPLFHSVTDDFREEDDQTERDREAADFFALQRSRRQNLGASHLQESSEAEEGRSGTSKEDGEDEGEQDGDKEREDGWRWRGGGGIRKSWRGQSSPRNKSKRVERVREESEAGTDSGSKGKGKMVEVGLDSVLGDRSDEDEPDDAHPPADITIEMAPDSDDDTPPAFQQFRRPPSASRERQFHPRLLPHETGAQSIADRAVPPDSDDDTVPPTIGPAGIEPPKHDAFWASLYLICLAALFASFFLVFLHTSAPSRKHPLGDTIYSALHSSFHLLAVDTVVAVLVSLLWLSLLRSFVRPLVYLIVVAAPVILISFAVYPLVFSFRGIHHGDSLQDRAMRWLSLVPAIGAVLWIYTVYKGRHSLAKAIGILEFASRILAANPALLALGFGTLIGVVIWTWLWLGMFTRVFLGGHLAKNIFVIDTGSWWLGIYFVMMYLWTLAIGGGVQRATTAATVSQWYFHRLAVPAPTSRQVVLAALSHATTTQLGTICLSTVLTLLIRLPILILPRRAVGLLAMFSYTLMPTSCVTLTNPLTLTHAAIHSQPLTASARDLTSMTILGPSTNPAAFSGRRIPRGGTSGDRSLLPYRLAKLLLHATRFIVAIALGAVGWVSTAKLLVLENTAIRGSLYAYVVGLLAGAIGWAVLGAMEAVLDGIVDGVVVCWGSEGGQGGRSGGGYCLEAEYLFGG